MTDKYQKRTLDSIKPYERNPRKIPQKAIDAVAESIKQFGFQSPIIIDKDNVVIAGHTRLLAAKKLGLAEVPVIQASELTPEQVKALRLVDNKAGEIAEWDMPVLDMELENIDMDMTKWFETATDDLQSIERKSLKPLTKVFTLIACDINQYDKVIHALTEIEKEEGIEINHVTK